MAFPMFKRWLRDSQTPAKKPTLRFERLDDRITPSASLVDINSSFSGVGDRPSTILDQSDDGRFIIFESKATNLITGQQDIPDTNDLFWKDLQTGITQMVTALPPVSPANMYNYFATLLSPQSFALQAIIDGAPIRPSFDQAVISGDGRFVAFTSVVNASRLDNDFRNQQFIPALADQNTYDLANTIDTFRYEAKSGTIEVASRTVASPDTKNLVTALGRYGSSANPAISSDGSYVAFTSTVEAWYTDNQGRPTQIDDGLIYDGANSSDIFVTSFNDAAGPNIQVVSAVETDVFYIEDVPPLITIESKSILRTYGHMAGGVGVTVDSNGDYLSVDIGGGVSVVGVASIDTTKIQNFGLDKATATSRFIDSNIAAITGSNGSLNNKGLNEAFRFSINAGLTENPNGFHLTAISSSTNGTVGVAANGGTAQTVEIASRNPNAILVTTSLGSSNPVFVPVLAPSPDRQDLYYITFTSKVNAKALNSNPLPSTITTTNEKIADTTQFSVSPNGKYVVHVQLDANVPQVFYRQMLPSIDVKATQISVGPDGKTPIAQGGTSPRVSQNGRYVTFLSVTPANAVAIGNIPDSNKVNDAFLRDLYFNTTVSNVTVVAPRTQLISTNSADNAAANGITSNVFIGSTFEDPVEGGPTPISAQDSLGRVAFNSKATNIDAGFIPTHLGNSIYVQSLPIGGLPPPVPPTDAPRTAVVSGGREAGVVQINFTGGGTVNLGQQLTPYPGFTGEIRVASADVNNDGIIDTIVAPGPGAGPRVIVFNGSNGSRLYDFFVFEPNFRGGVNIAAADINADGSTKNATTGVMSGKAEIIVGADKGGGARVRVLDVNNGGKALVDFFAYDVNFRGGVRVATGDFNGDKIVDVLTGAGNGGGPRVSAFNGVGIKGGTLNRFIDFFAMELNLRNGVFVAGGDLNNDGIDDIVVGAGEGGGPRVAVFESASVIARPNTPDLIFNFFAGNVNSRAGIRVAVKNVDGDAIADIVTGEGRGRESRVRSFSGGMLIAPFTPGEIGNNFVVFNDLTSLNGAWVG